VMSTIFDFDKSRKYVTNTSATCARFAYIQYILSRRSVSNME